LRAGDLQTGPVAGVAGNILPWALSGNGEQLLLPQFDRAQGSYSPITVVVNAEALRGRRPSQGKD